MSDNIKSEEESTPKKKRELTGRQKEKVLQDFEVYITDPDNDNLAFIARELVLCTLPHSDPGDVPAWSRTNGNFTLTIRPGWNREKQEVYGYPYGTIPRLILVWMVTEILRTKSRRLELGNSLSDFMETLGLNSSNGSTKAKRSDARRLNQQIDRLINSIISFEYSVSNENGRGRAWVNMQVAPKGVLWWDHKDPDAIDFGSWIDVGEDFFNAILQNPYPLDIRVLRQIKNSALGIDLYMILNREAYRAYSEKKPRFLAWEWLYIQTGNEYNQNDDGLRNFRKKSIEQIKQILDVHSGLKIEIQKGRKGQKSGLVIRETSTPSIRPEQFGVKSKPEALAKPTAPLPPQSASVPLPPSPLSRQLKPATVEEFRRLYPRLDPYACKYAFDAWLEPKGEEEQPMHYDRAFMGFASKWTKGKS